MADEQLTVRLCTADDLPNLMALETSTTQGAAIRHYERQDAGDYYYAVAFRNEVPLGTCALDTHADNPLCPELMNLWVYPEHRRQGAAKALTRFLEQMARDAAMVEVFLRVDPNNEAAIPMYISLDYTPTGDHLIKKETVTTADGETATVESTEAVYRKSLLAR